MYTLLTIIHIFACIVLILTVLLQTGKGADMGAAFGGSSQTVFGSAGPGTFLGKMTTAIAIIFMLTSLSLAYFAINKTDSIITGTPLPITESSPSSETEAKDKVAATQVVEPEAAPEESQKPAAPAATPNAELPALPSGNEASPSEEK